MYTKIIILCWNFKIVLLNLNWEKIDFVTLSWNNSGKSSGQIIHVKKKKLVIKTSVGMKELCTKNSKWDFD